MMSKNSMLGEASHISVAVASPVFEGKVLAVQSIVISTGQTISGGVSSTMIMLCRHVVMLPQISVAVQVLAMEYSSGQLGEVIVTSAYVTIGLGSQLSLAVILPVAGGKVLAVHCRVKLAGQVIVGAILSSTVMTWLHVLLF